MRTGIMSIAVLVMAATGAGPFMAQTQAQSDDLRAVELVFTDGHRQSFTVRPPFIEITDVQITIFKSKEIGVSDPMRFARKDVRSLCQGGCRHYLSDEREPDDYVSWRSGSTGNVTYQNDKFAQNGKAPPNFQPSAFSDLDYIEFGAR